MERTDKHLSPELIWGFVSGLSALRSDEFQHLLDCDQCSDASWRFEQEARRESGEDDAKQKTAWTDELAAEESQRDYYRGPRRLRQ